VRKWYLWVALAAVELSAADAKTAKKIEFNRDVRPILSDKCYACHGPDDRKRIAGLRLDTFEGATKARGQKQPIVPGDAEHSRILARVVEPKEELRMPPPKAGPRLTDQEVSVLRTWIQQGAQYQQHWAYIAPERPAAPTTSNPRWIKNPIDSFILARLDQEKLKPSVEADRATLLRRASFDLTGLPPTPAEVNAFLKDKSPDAYEKQVDRLLASPQYGERMAMQWLDLARYADTHGFHIDSHRDMWPWRDWVIKAYNENKSYKDFVVEQLAGDLLPNATRDQLIATGFHRNHMINFEGGAIPEEYLMEYVADRAETTATVFMGMTMGCARCHDHKYDPIKQKDFYRMFAFFNAVPESGLDGRAGNAKPFLRLSTPDQEAELKRLDKEIAALEVHFKGQKVQCAVEEWELSRARVAAPSRDGLVGHFEFDGHLADTSGAYRHGIITSGPGGAFREGAIQSEILLNGESQLQLPGALDFERNQPFSVSVFAQSVITGEGALLQRIEDANSRRGIEIVFAKSRALGDLKRGAEMFVRLSSDWPNNAIEVKTKLPVTFVDRHHFAVTYDGSGKAAGLKVFVDGKERELIATKDSLSGSIKTNQPLTISNPNLGYQPYNGSLDDLRIYSRTIDEREIKLLQEFWPVELALQVAPSKRSQAQKDLLIRHFLHVSGTSEWLQRQRQLDSLRAERKQLLDHIVTVMTMSDSDKPRKTHILARGDYRNKGEEVTPATPHFLQQIPADLPSNRLSLAYWLTDNKHPLTSRVAVNRFWFMLFGTGLVKTLEDFGSQGELPSHPELMDWLATEFTQNNWDVKHMMRLMVTSATYRQSSKSSPEINDRDPQNRLLSHGPRFRLPAEMVRDNALAASGLLTNRIGGPSVRVYQPPNVWEELAFGGEYSAQTYQQDHGDALYRRSMYIFAKRTAPHPAMITFDAPDREKCTARRLVTNTPLQALVLMNDPTYVESSRALAQRMLLEGGTDFGSRIKHGFQLTTAREPNAKERQVLRDLAERLEQRFRRDPEAASKLLSVGESPVPAQLDKVELATWTMVANTMLNMDETVTKE
jgi:hypothetical protein